MPIRAAAWFTRSRILRHPDWPQEALDWALTYNTVRDKPGDDWPLGDPLERLKQHLIALGEWSEDRHETLNEELEKHVMDCWKEAMSYGTLTDGPKLDPDEMFEDVFAEMPEHLKKQRAHLKKLRS